MWRSSALVTWRQEHYTKNKHSVCDSLHTNKPQKEKQLGVDHDPEHEDVDDEDVVHPMLLYILWQLVVPDQPGGKQREHKLLLLMLQE